jgi:hypothetical protein
MDFAPVRSMVNRSISETKAAGRHCVLERDEEVFFKFLNDRRPSESLMGGISVGPSTPLRESSAFCKSIVLVWV